MPSAKKKRNTDKQVILAMLGDCMIMNFRLWKCRLRSFVLPEGEIGVDHEDDALIVTIGEKKYEVTVKAKKS